MGAPESQDSLPPPPPGRTGWPWAVTHSILPPVRPDGRPWPRISIITPSFNQAAFLEEAIRSVLLQGYPNLEYFVLDGGSSDGSADIVRKYSPWLSGWRSAPDAGQAAAINEGLARSTGQIFQFINSDDVVAPGALAAVGAAWQRGAIVAGSVVEFGAEGNHLVRNRRLTPRLLLTTMYRGPRCSYHQPGVWLERERLSALGGFPIDLRYCFDFYALALYLERWPNVRYLSEALVRFRIHQGQKTSERAEVAAEYAAARLRLQDRLRSPTMRRMARRGLDITRWPGEVSAIRNSDRSTAGKVAALTARLFANPAVAFNRLTLGAIRRELAAWLTHTNAPRSY